MPPIPQRKPFSFEPKQIQETERPFIAYEHPTIITYINSVKENVIRYKNKKSKYTQHDDYIKELFSNDTIDLKTQCNAIVSYISESFIHYSVWDFSHAYYPGRPSQQTAKIDAMEGTSRTLPTLAAWLHANGKENTYIIGLNKKPINVPDVLRHAFLAGTNPHHKGFWGQLHDYDQRTCESADLALALWMSKEWVWDYFSNVEKQQITTWFKQVNHCKTVDNNWHLFVLTVQLILKNLTGDNHIQYQKYQRIKEFYVGDGWFRDGAKGNYDYYNAWAFHYSLYWFTQIEPEFDADFIRSSLSDLVANYRYFFTTKGLPFFGRSACYRLAATVPLLAAVDLQNSTISIGEAKRAFSTNLKYFISNGALQAGIPTQGIFGDDPRLVDNYSGPASSLWSLRALNIALFCGDKINLWQAEETLLAIEKENFEFDIPSINMKVIGIFDTQEVITIFKNEYIQDQSPLSRRLLSSPSWRLWFEIITGRANRPKNNLLRKGVTCYSSKMGRFF
ncbi:DUF2264 domain-containing protein [Aliivibrio sp. EL58]|uniref:DUF2264 domain-containing protein n=1 Tax=Aliivibrio sp. EL58 TaxID=2107582 RepID=UPI000EFB40EE|nr:DUF2264 domain-containing protein [Aliivibrio sp. EL58]